MFQRSLQLLIQALTTWTQTWILDIPLTTQLLNLPSFHFLLYKLGKPISLYNCKDYMRSYVSEATRNVFRSAQESYRQIKEQRWNKRKQNKTENKGKNVPGRWECAVFPGITSRGNCSLILYIRLVSHPNTSEMVLLRVAGNTTCPSHKTIFYNGLWLYCGQW